MSIHPRRRAATDWPVSARSWPVRRRIGRPIQLSPRYERAVSVGSPGTPVSRRGVPNVGVRRQANRPGFPQRPCRQHRHVRTDFAVFGRLVTLGPGSIARWPRKLYVKLRLSVTSFRSPTRNGDQPPGKTHGRFHDRAHSGMAGLAALSTSSHRPCNFQTSSWPESASRSLRSD